MRRTRARALTCAAAADAALAHCSAAACSSRYRANAPKLESALCLMEKFEPYHDIPKVQSLEEVVEVLSRGLHQQLLREFQLQWLVTDPFAGRHATADSSYDEKQAIRTEQEQVRAAAPLTCTPIVAQTSCGVSLCRCE